MWVSEDGEEQVGLNLAHHPPPTLTLTLTLTRPQVCVGSIQELAELSGVTLTDLHRENVDKVTQHLLIICFILIYFR